MNRKIQYDSIKWISPELGQGIVKGYDKVIEGLGAEIKTGQYTAYAVRREESIAAKKRARQKRLEKWASRKII